MLLFGKTVDHITPADIQRLVEDGVRESKTLEYKETLPSSSDEAKREFLADISSLANTNGGVIVYGLSEKRDEEGNKLGFPASPIHGIDKFSADEDIRRLENILRSGLDPPISSFMFNPIEVEEKTVLLLGIGRSLFAPHMVDYKNHTRFYSRGNTLKQRMSVDELRRAFLEMSSWEEQAKQFRAVRLKELFEDPAIVGHAKVIAPLVTHIIPLGRSGSLLDLKQLPNRLSKGFPNFEYGQQGTFDIDGYIAFAPLNTECFYMRFFRWGAIETYACSDVDKWYGAEKSINAVLFERNTRDLLETAIPFLQANSIDAPYMVFLSLLQVQGHSFRPPGRGMVLPPAPIKRNELLVPGVLVPTTSQIMMTMKQAFEVLWQGAGWSHCPGYDSRNFDEA